MGAIAGAEVGLPANIDEVTPEWLTAVLRTSGAIDGATSVASTTSTPFAEGLGLLSYLFRAELTYHGAAGPEAVIVKFATDIPNQRGIADALAFYQRELRFYRELGDRVPLRTPTAHAVVMAEDSNDFVLVMEELTGLRTMDQIAGATAADAVLAARGVAAFQAPFWGQDLADLQQTFLPLDNPIHRAALPGVFAGGWERCKAEAAELLTPEVVAFGDRYGEVLPWALDQLSTSTTLLHGDWRADNLLVDAAGELAVIDFQISGTGTGVYDLAYFLSQSVEPEIRRPNEQAIIDAYYGGLDDHGIVYDRAELEREFRLASAFCLIYPVSVFGGWDEVPENSRAVMLAGLRRSVSTIVDHDALALLPG